MPADQQTATASRPPLQHRLPQRAQAAFHQGELDGLCGLYAALNGLRLLLAPHRPLTRHEVKNLFDDGIRFLDKRGTLAAAAIEGFQDEVWRPLVNMLVAEAGLIVGHTIEMAQPLAKAARPSRATTFAVIETAIAAGQPVLADLSGAHQHFTVISGYSPYSLFLFDSGALYWLTRKSCSTAKWPGKQRHHINPRSLTVLSLQC